LITRREFCQELRERLLRNRNKAMLRVVTAPHFDRPREFTGQTLLDGAELLAGSLIDSPRFSGEGRIVLLLLPHCPELFLLQLGLVLRGHIPAVLPWPTSRIEPDKYQRNLVHQLKHLPAAALVTLPQLANNLPRTLPYPAIGIAIDSGAKAEAMFPSIAVSEQSHQVVKNRAVPPDAETLFLQFSGGTTGAQKAVGVTAEMLRNQFGQLQRALEFTADDTVVSWLPMYHDMGLIACYWAPLWYAVPSIQIAAADWVMNPELLLRHISQYRGTVCWLPNFSFSYLSQRREFMRDQYELNSVRAWINCSEPVRHKSIEEFVSTFSGWGVEKGSVQASYAMAETVFAVTQSQLGKELPTYPRAHVLRCGNDYAALAFDLIDDVYISSGKPLEGTGIRILRNDGSTCDEGEAGEISVRTPSLFAGYWSADGLQAHTVKDGWHSTGDYGFLANGELFVIGRFKDIVIVGGNNIFPEDVEAVVNTIPNVYAGRTVAFGIDDPDYGTQSLAIVAEMKSDYEQSAATSLESAIRKLVLATIGTAPRHVAVVPRRWIVKSTAGKISRRDTRAKFIRETELREREAGL
jgi:fatty-acyl-CoA synthase